MTEVQVRARCAGQPVPFSAWMCFNIYMTVVTLRYEQTLSLAQPTWGGLKCTYTLA